MAARKKKVAGDAGAEGQADPRASLDGAAFLAALSPVARTLEADLLARARASKAVLRGLEERWQREKDAHRTADPFEVWQHAFVEQVAAAWILSAVFVRTLEDRGLLGQNRLAGPGAMDAQRAFFDLAPSLSERDYLLLTFRELSHLPAARALFDARHNPVWMLAPSVEGARTLLGLFRAPSAEAPTFRFGGSDTRFLGDLYQDLSEDVRKRYALLQTPRFVERYILDRTLDRALERFGVSETTVLDPTCGSGHFLLGAFERLREAFLRAEPGLDPREAAQRALDRVAGSDVNPYAVAIARFRLTLAFVEAGQYARLSDAPEPRLHLCVADSLLHGKDGGAQRTLDQIRGVSAEEIWGRVYALEDEEAARDVLGKKYAAVVGNPPYITVKDAAVREEIRRSYPRSAFRSYSLAAPFAERFFQLARSGGAVGMITANSFMKREFGKKLIEDVVPELNLDGIVNTSGAYIPGHGTPTVLLFGTNEPPVEADVLSVLAKRGEPTTPDDPEQGLVWRSVVDHGGEVGFENDYVSVARVSREALRKHPWTLGGGGASDLKELLEERCDRRLGDVVAAVGRTTVAGEDDIWIADTPGTWARQGLAVRAVPLVLGECVRDWTITGCPEILYPYETLGGPAIDDRDPLVRHLWRWRVTLQNRTVFGKSFKDGKRPWWEHLEHYSEKLRTPLGIAFAFVATHNHFVLDRGGKVFKQTAPIIKLPPDATEDDHLALLAYLNSSTACFWMKQVCMNKGATSDKGVLQADEDKFRYEFDGTKLRLMPVPPLEVLRPLIPLARALTEECTTVSAESYRAVLDAAGDRDAAAAGWARLDDANAQMRTRAVAFQEEIDWAVYSIIGFEGAPHYVPHATVGTEEAGYEPDERPFASSMRPSLIDRIGAIGGSAQLQFLESAEFKRRWYRSQGKFNAKAVTDDTLHVVAYDLFVLAAAERAAQAAAMIAPAGAIIRGASHALDVARGVALSVLGSATTPEEDLATRLAADAVPFLAAYRYTDAGLEKLSAWERTWDLQRREDAREDVGTIPVPPKYAQGDFREGSYWRLRGKLDVPKERFISYPGCEGDDGEPLYGWAGWDHKQRAMALMTLYQERKTQDGWDKERLTPMLAGLRELLPWLRQWHRDVDPDFGMSMADYFAGLYDAERAALGVSDQELAAWRPQAKRGGRNKA